jgi:thymidylate synthase (FAD)
MTNEKNQTIFLYNDNVGYISLVDSMVMDPMLKTVCAARASYNKKSDKFTDKDKKLVAFLAKEEHTSPFRHSFFTFEICVPLFVFRQWIKYQVGCAWKEFEVGSTPVTQDLFLEINDLQFDTDKGCTWNELSARYTELEPQFYIPERMRTNAGHGNKQASSEPSTWTDSFHDMHRHSMEDFCKDAFIYYKRLIDSGIAREQARAYLPQAIYTRAYWTCSLQAVLHFLKQRLKDDAQYEIRVAAQTIKKLIQDYLDSKLDNKIDLDSLIDSHGKV